MKTKLFLCAILSCAALTFACKDDEVVSINASTDAVTFAAEGGTTTITLNVTDTWAFDSIPSWMTISPLSGHSTDGDIEVTMTADVNNSDSDHNVEIVVVSSGKSQPISVTQPSTGYGEIISIAKAYAASSTAHVKGYVAGLTTEGYLLYDGTGSILVDYGETAAAGYAIGNEVEISGAVSAVDNSVRIVPTIKYEANIGSTTMNYPTSKQMTAEVLKSYADSLSTESGSKEITSEYVFIQGLLKQDGDDYVISVEGADGAAFVAFKPTADSDLASLVNEGVQIKGFLVGSKAGTSAELFQVVIVSIEKWEGGSPIKTYKGTYKSSMLGSDFEQTLTINTLTGEYTLTHPYTGAALMFTVSNKAITYISGFEGIAYNRPWGNAGSSSFYFYTDKSDTYFDTENKTISLHYYYYGTSSHCADTFTWTEDAGGGDGNSWEGTYICGPLSNASTTQKLTYDPATEQYSLTTPYTAYVTDGLLVFTVNADKSINVVSGWEFSKDYGTYKLYYAYYTASASCWFYTGTYTTFDLAGKKMTITGYTSTYVYDYFTW